MASSLSPSRVAATQAIQSGLQLLRVVFESSTIPQLILDSSSFRILALNQSACELFGLPKETVVSTLLDAYFPPHDNPLPALHDDIRKHPVGLRSSQWTLRKPDRTESTVMATISPIFGPDGHLSSHHAFLVPLTLKETQLLATKERQDLLNQALLHLPLAIVALDTRFRITSISGTLPFFNTRQTEVIGKPVTTFIKGGATNTALQNALLGITSTLTSVHPKGTHVTHYGPIRSSKGRIVGVVAVISNAPQSDTTTPHSSRPLSAPAPTNKDPLTGLENRAALLDRLNEIAQANQPQTLFLVNLDGFTLINNALGLDLGDNLLRTVGRQLATLFNDQLVARLAGDEFAIAFPYQLNEEQSAQVAHKIQNSLNADMTVNRRFINISACVSSATNSLPSKASTLIANAATALSLAKSQGPGQYRPYDEEMRRQVEDRLLIQNGLETALRENKFTLVYQPIFSLIGRRTQGCETLLRWTHPGLGPVSPVEFIPVAEQSGLIVPIGRFVMETACKAAATLVPRFHLYISVNVAARQLLDPNFAFWIESVLANSSLPPSALTIEVTESAFIDELGPIRAALERLRAQGIKISIDDFGTGYSSLSRLQNLPIDVIKLDRAFVTNLENRPDARIMASAIRQMTTSIGATNVAEGIETEAEAKALIDLGYTMGQGYLFSRGVSLQEFTTLLEQETS